MSESLPEIYLARHGETAWTLTHQHTGRTDLELTDRLKREEERVVRSKRDTGASERIKMLYEPFPPALRTAA